MGEVQKRERKRWKSGNHKEGEKQTEVKIIIRRFYRPRLSLRITNNWLLRSSQLTRQHVSRRSTDPSCRLMVLTCTKISVMLVQWQTMNNLLQCRVCSCLNSVFKDCLIRYRVVSPSNVSAQVETSARIPSRKHLEPKPNSTLHMTRLTQEFLMAYRGR